MFPGDCISERRSHQQLRSREDGEDSEEVGQEVPKVRRKLLRGGAQPVGGDGTKDSGIQVLQGMACFGIVKYGLV